MLLVQTETKAKDQNMAEIEVLTEYGNVIAKYEGFETVYKELDGGMILSNDGTVYVEQPEQEPDVDQIRTAKLAEVEKHEDDNQIHCTAVCGRCTVRLL